MWYLIRGVKVVENTKFQLNISKIKLGRRKKTLFKLLIYYLYNNTFIHK